MNFIFFLLTVLSLVLPPVSTALAAAEKTTLELDNQIRLIMKNKPNDVVLYDYMVKKHASKTIDSAIYCETAQQLSSRLSGRRSEADLDLALRINEIAVNFCINSAKEDHNYAGIAEIRIASIKKEYDILISRKNDLIKEQQEIEENAKSAKGFDLIQVKSAMEEIQTQYCPVKKRLDA